MPQPRKYPTNAARQAAYRKRKAAAERQPVVERFQRSEDGSVNDHRGRVWDPDTREWRAPINPASPPRRETRA